MDQMCVWRVRPVQSVLAEPVLSVLCVQMSGGRLERVLREVRLPQTAAEAGLRVRRPAREPGAAGKCCFSISPDSLLLHFRAQLGGEGFAWEAPVQFGWFLQLKMTFLCSF